MKLRNTYKKYKLLSFGNYWFKSESWNFVTAPIFILMNQTIDLAPQHLFSSTSDYLRELFPPAERYLMIETRVVALNHFCLCLCKFVNSVIVFPFEISRSRFFLWIISYLIFSEAALKLPCYVCFQQPSVRMLSLHSNNKTTY